MLPTKVAPSRGRPGDRRNGGRVALTHDSLTSVDTTADIDDQQGMLDVGSGKAPEATGMAVRKRNGSLEPVDVTKIVRAVERCGDGLSGVDPMRIATRTISGLCDGATTEELDELSIRTAASLIVEEPNYSKLAARLLSTYIDKEVKNQNIHSFSQSVMTGHALGLINAETVEFVTANARKLNDAVDTSGDRLFEFFGLRTVYDRYLLRHPEHRKVTETPQYFMLRVACGLSTSPEEGDPLLPVAVEPRIPGLEPDAVQLRHRPPADVLVLPARFARGRPRGHLRPLQRRGQALQARRRHRPGLQPHPQPRLAHPRHQRPVQRHRALAQDTRQFGVGGQPGRSTQGRRVRLPRILARRYRGVPRTQGQRRRRGPAHPQPESRQLGPRPVHGAGREGLAVVAVRSQGGPPLRRPLRRGVRTRLPRGPRKPGSTSVRCRPASSTAA